jgi:hypothetical protein
MKGKAKARIEIKISGAGVLSTDSAQLFKSEKGQRQVEALRRLKEIREKREEHELSSTAASA